MCHFVGLQVALIHGLMTPKLPRSHCSGKNEAAVMQESNPNRATTTTTTTEPAVAAARGEVALFTERPAVEQQWAGALAAAGLRVRTHRPAALPAAITTDAFLVIDAGTAFYDEDELLAHVGLARALGALPVVAAAFGAELTGVDDIIDDLCGGRVARRAEDVSRLAASLARHVDTQRGRRFEYLTVSPRGGELLAIFSDGTAVVLNRGELVGDEGARVSDISFEDDGGRATLTFDGGGTLDVTPAAVANRSLLRTNGKPAEGPIDGVRLGARIRELRLAAGLTQAELARRTGIHRPNIARVEAGRHTPSLETLSRLAHAIGVPTTRVLD